MSTFSPTEAPYLSSLEKGIIDEVNRARTNPTAYAAYLEGIRNSLTTREGPSAIAAGDVVLQLLIDDNIF